ncbi:hypothetical protein C0Q70_14062 [Pomacea canaliculata]|uniref:Neutral metalloproteinase n=1 Tax=Pomacea canaliculata TaxID=400727 RepID=A0A2T7NYY7_POMCA|nr:uncharacterized protein LOC112570531 [Pomacea canaliculata]PVD26388.1 hypothetical protein C0Q70_14062 [Pomacea canaliculata]
MEKLLKPLTVVFLVFAVHGVRAARRVDANVHLQNALYKRQLQMADMTSDMSWRQRRETTPIPIAELDEVMALGPNSALEVTRSVTTVQGTRLLRLQETFKDKIVNDAVLTVETDSTGQHVYDASGAVYQGIEDDTDGTGNIDSQTALDICVTFNEDDAIIDDISDVKTEPEIFFDKQNHAYPGYLVQYLVLGETEERRPSCIVDARDGRVTTSWDALDSCDECVGKGTGGNRKIGRIHYGELHKCLDVKRVNDTCYTENKYVKVIDNNGLFIENETELYNFSDAATYDCEEATDQINGAYSPMLDALFYGTAVARMFEDWYDTTPLDGQIILRVHVGVNLSNAFWNGRETQFGDGDESMHPLVSIDIAGHEIGHGVTEQSSGLLYFNQWGAINEAFSDMMGEASEAYLWKADWVAGFDIIKKGQSPLRFFENPTADNRSISHVDNFTDDLDVHLGSGVYNRVFYLLVHEYQQSIKEIFGVFLHANRMYWHHMSDYHSAACDVMKAAYDLGQNGALFRRAFKEVGIEVCDTESHILGLRINEPYNNITVATDASPVFRFVFPGNIAELTGVGVSANSFVGDVHIVLSNKSWDADEEDPKILAEGDNFVKADITSNSAAVPVYITLSNESKVPLTEVTLKASLLLAGTE